MSFTGLLRDFISQMASVFSTFKVVDFFDICVVAFIIYKAIQLIRETRAVQLLKGMLLFGAVYLIAVLSHMEAVSFLLDIVKNWGLLALVIVFQPEIRSALEQMGRSSIRRLGVLNMTKDQEEKYRIFMTSAIGETVSACESMSRKRTGALIVFERKSMLGDVVKTGTVVNADVTAAMLESIFFPNSPLHDGAVVIREGRVFAAGCILPLSQNPEISRELGTRHRAAIGLSEESDAVTIVVSEETGALTLAQKGILCRGMTPGALRAELITALLESDREENDVKKRRFAFWGRKKKQ